MAWTVFYDDETTFSDFDGDIDTSPNKGVVCIAVDGVAEPISGNDWYFYHKDQGWMTCSLHQLLYQVCNDLSNILVVRQGALVSTEKYETLIQRAKTAFST